MNLLITFLKNAKKGVKWTSCKERMGMALLEEEDGRGGCVGEKRGGETEGLLLREEANVRQQIGGKLHSQSSRAPRSMGRVWRGATVTLIILLASSFPIQTLAALKGHHKGGHHRYKSTRRIRRAVHDVTWSGAKCDGSTDDTDAIARTFTMACARGRRPTRVVVPTGRTCVIRGLRLRGCGGVPRLTLQIDGALVAPADPARWHHPLPRALIHMENMRGISMEGRGSIDLRGSAWWGSSITCGRLCPASIAITNSIGATINGITLKNAVRQSLVIEGCRNVVISSLTVFSPPNSLPADAISIIRSFGVTRTNIQSFSAGGSTGGARVGRRVQRTASSNLGKMALEFLQHHNQARAVVNVNPPLPPLVWSNQVAAVAQSWANELGAQGCAFYHGGMGNYGQNLFKGSGVGWTPGQAVKMWFDEGQKWDYNAGCKTGNWADCGHFTQIVWRDTTQVGCGMTNCGGQATLYVCNYNPSGNYVGQKPY